MTEITALYFNGLGDGTIGRSETMIFTHLKKKGVNVIPAHVNWRSDEPFTSIFDKMTSKAKGLLKSSGSLALVGASAGGSMAINVSKQLDDSNVQAVNLSGRLRRGTLPSWDPRKLDVSAHLGTDNASPSFYDSIIYCEDTTIPNLDKEDKDNITIVKPWMDFVVPLDTMTIEGCETIAVAGLWHQHGIGLGLLRLPGILIE
ncbi:MAG TPA: hypothetical protein VIH90_04565 [Candidatus Saccharimonadales bacterium]